MLKSKSESLEKRIKDISDNCGATFCMLAGNDFYWHPEETICRCYRKKAVQEYLGLKNGKAPDWIKAQERISEYCSKKYKRQAPYAFTYDMLDQNIRVIKGSTKGVDVDYDIDMQIDRFFNTSSTSTEGENYE